LEVVDMPGRDGTGPFGEGPLTGRGMGPCGRGLAFRRGCRRWSNDRMRPVILSKDEQKSVLNSELKEIEEEIKELEREKEQIEKKLKELQ
jgi:predicted Fe-S protein YdhL (DUF1289 family)